MRRFYEAGADDMVTLPLSSTLMDTHEAAQWTAAWLLVAVSVGLALRKVYAAPRPRVVSMIDLRQAARKQVGGSAPSGAPASASDGTPSPVPGGPEAHDAEGPLKPRAPQPGWMPQGFQQVTTLAAAIQGARNCSQTLIFNCLFVATGGNLAATFTASLANQLLFSALQRSSMERMQKVCREAGGTGYPNLLDQESVQAVSVLEERLAVQHGAHAEGARGGCWARFKMAFSRGCTPLVSEGGGVKAGCGTPCPLSASRGTHLT